MGLTLEELIDPEIESPGGGENETWREICHNAFQTQLNINKRKRQATEKAFELGIHVPLGLVERKQQTRRQQAEDFAPERGAEAYQLSQEVVEKRYEYDKFLKEIIGDTAF